MEVIVEHNYIAKEPDELTIKKGDIIHDVVRKPGGWWEGVLRDKRGMFPDNFVRPLDQNISFRNKKDAARIRQCRVIFSYKQDHEDELNLNVGDIIEILGEEEEGWWRGILNGKEGVFPSNFVQEITPPAPVIGKENLAPAGWVVDNSIDLPSASPKPHKTVCQVKYAYTAENDDELTIKEGDLVTLIDRDSQDPGWWKGELNGKIGVFPDNFVVVLTPEEVSHLQKREEYSNLQKKEEFGNLQKRDEKRDDFSSLQKRDELSNLQKRDDLLNNLPKRDDLSGLQKRDELSNMHKRDDPSNLQKQDEISSSHKRDEFSSLQKKDGFGSLQKMDFKPKKASDDEMMLSSKIPDSSANKHADHSVMNSNDQVPPKLVDEKSETDPSSRVIPPVPGKKPSFPIKKSPSSSGSHGLFAGLRKKLVDAVDGASSSKTAATTVKTTEIKETIKTSSSTENAFDQVGRTPMLMDVRATRAKAPGRRPPSVVGKEGEPGITNGFAEHSTLEVLSESSSSEQVEDLPKPKEAERSKQPPWLEEMKLNQAKRSSTSPKQEQNKLRPLSDKSSSPENEDDKVDKPPVEKEIGITETTKIDMTKPGLHLKPKISPIDAEVITRKMVPPPARPQTIHTIPDAQPIKPQVTAHLSTKQIPSPSMAKVSPPPKPHISDAKAEQGKPDLFNLSELLERVKKLEKKSQEQEAAIEDLRARLQVETDMRLMLQAELERVSECVMHV